MAAATVATELGLALDQIDSRFPCQYVSTGLEFLLVPLTSYDALRQAHVTLGELAQGYFLFCAGGYVPEQQLQVRMFAAQLGVPEDPATGSANGCLAGYLVEHEYFGTSAVEVAVGQGYEVGRPSQLYLKSKKEDDQFVIEVGGRVNVVAEGQWKR